MLSRRKLLAVTGSATVAGVAGCSGSESGGGGTRDCQTTAVDRGDGDVLDGAVRATADDGGVLFVVPLEVEAVRNTDTEALELYDAANELAYRIPVSPDDADVMANKDGLSEGRLRYEQSLGPRPAHGEYRIVAVTAADEAVDSLTVEFNCFSDVDG